MMSRNHSHRNNGASRLAGSDSRFTLLSRQLLSRAQGSPDHGMVIGVTGAARGASIQQVVEGIAISAAQQDCGEVLLVDLWSPELPALIVGFGTNQAESPDFDDSTLPPPLGRPTLFDRLFQANATNLLRVATNNGSIANERTALQRCRSKFALTLIGLPDFSALHTAGNWLVEVDEVLAVFESGTTSLRAAEAGISHLRNSGISILGSVLVNAG